MPGNATPATPPPFSASRWASFLWLAALATVLSLHVWFPRIEAAVNDTYNVDFGGRNALYQFAERLARRSQSRRNQSSRNLGSVDRNHQPLVGRLDVLDEDSTLCLLGPARYPSSQEWQALLKWVGGGGKLLVAARWNDAELTIPGIKAAVKSTVEKKSFQPPGADKRKKKDGSSSDDEPSTQFTKQAAVAVPVTTVLDPRGDFTWKTEGVVEAPTAEVLVNSASGPQAVLLHHGWGTIVLVASDFIFSNAALNERGHINAILAVKLLEAAGSDSLVFDESLNETGTPRVVGVLLDPVVRPTTIQFVALIVLFGWRGNRRFGGLLPKSSPPRHDVADHTNSLGNLYYKAHHGAGVLREYLDQLKTELRLRYAAGHEKRVLLAIAQKANLSLEEVQQILAEAEAAIRKPRISRREAAAHIRKLALLRRAAHAHV